MRHCQIHTIPRQTCTFLVEGITVSLLYKMIVNNFVSCAKRLVGFLSLLIFHLVRFPLFLQADYIQFEQTLLVTVLKARVILGMIIP